MLYQVQNHQMRCLSGSMPKNLNETHLAEAVCNSDDYVASLLLGKCNFHQDLMSDLVPDNFEPNRTQSVG